MTLILTELSPLGIVMVGDTAITYENLMPDRTFQSRSLNGITKVIPVSKINAGISYWGWTHIDNFNDIKGIPIDWWINTLLMENHDHYQNINELAEILLENLREKIPPMTEEELVEFEYGNGGIHLAGYDYIGDVKVPSFWHIHNGRSQRVGDEAIDPLIVNANHDVTPDQMRDMFSKRNGYFTVNGENKTFNLLVYEIKEFLEEKFQAEGVIIPVPNIMARAKFWRAFIVFISNLYQVSGSLIQTDKYDMIFDYPASVGDEISILTIQSDRISNYVTY